MDNLPKAKSNTLKFTLNSIINAEHLNTFTEMLIYTIKFGM